MKSGTKVAITATTLATLVLLLMVSSVPFTSASSNITISPTSGIVGSKILISGEGYEPNTNLMLKWESDNVSWTLAGNPTETTGMKAVPVEWQLANVETDSSGSFSVQVSAPVDNGGKHVIQAYSQNGTALTGLEIFALEPSFNISSLSGAVGSPITIFAHGLGLGIYSTNYHVMWDNKYIGYMTAVTTHGEANATIYATGSLGVHYIDIYQGYPGAAYLNPHQNPSPGNWYPPYLPFQATYKITSNPFVKSNSSVMGGSPFIALLSLSLIVCAFALVPVMASMKMGNRRNLGRAISRIGVILVIAALLIAAGGIYAFFVYSPAASPVSSYVPQESVVRPMIVIPEQSATLGPRISVSPSVATVGTVVNVTGQGFSPDSKLTVSWSTRVGNNLNGFTTVNRPLENVTANKEGSFTFPMQVPSDLEGDHFISVDNLTLNSNATLYIERNATVFPREGPVGTNITIQLLGTGWDFNNNIVVIDYDNSYVGYACGFNSQGNITVTIPAAGAPGLHSIDLYPSIYLGPPQPSQNMIYRYPIMTPYDHPEKVPSFHFSFLVTSSNATSTGSNFSNELPLVISLASASLGGLYVAVFQPGLVSRRLVRVRD